jgi:hypothetical protein
LWRMVWKSQMLARRAVRTSVRVGNNRVLGRPPAQHAPEALDQIQGGAGAGQARQRQLRLGREHLGPPSTLGPGRGIDRPDPRLAQRSRIRPGGVVPGGGKGVLQPGRWPEPGAALGRPGALDQARRQGPRPPFRAAKL